MADVVPLNPAGWGGQVQKLGKIFRGQSLLLLTLLGAEKFEVCIALHQLDQISFLSLLRAADVHLALPLFREPVLQQILLGQGVLHKKFWRNLHGIHLAVMLLDHPLQNHSRLHPTGISGITESPDQLAGPHLKQLHSCKAIVTGQSQHIPAHGRVRQAHLLVCRQLIQTLQLVTHASSGFKIEALGVAFHLLLKQGLELVAAALKHHRHLAQNAVVGL